MYKINTISKFRNIAILLSLSVGFVLALSADVSAQYGNYGYSRDSRYSNNSSSIAQRYGYQDGFKDGADAAREGDRFHPQNSGDWQKGTNGYESSYGNRGSYKQAYRSAYMNGYRAGFERNNNRGRDRDRRDRSWNTRW